MTTEYNAPMDALHAQSRQAINAIREEVNRLHAQVAQWEPHVPATGHAPVGPRYLTTLVGNLRAGDRWHPTGPASGEVLVSSVEPFMLGDEPMVRVHGRLTYGYGGTRMPQSWSFPCWMETEARRG